MSYPENSVGRPLPMEADPDAMNDKDEVRLPCFFKPNAFSNLRTAWAARCPRRLTRMP